MQTSALQMKPALEAKAKENKVDAGKETGRGNKKVSPKSDEPFRVDAEIAKAAGVGKDTVRKVETVLKSGDDATKKAMLAALPSSICGRALSQTETAASILAQMVRSVSVDAHEPRDDESKQPRRDEFLSGRFRAFPRWLWRVVTENGGSLTANECAECG